MDVYPPYAEGKQLLPPLMLLVVALLLALLLMLLLLPPPLLLFFWTLVVPTSAIALELLFQGLSPCVLFGAPVLGATSPACSLFSDP